MARVFICYSRKDAQFVDGLVRDLRAAGVNTWRDLDDIPRDIRSNTSGWRDAVAQGLRDSSHMLIILSPNSVQSEEVKAEWNFFLGHGRTVYPVLYADCDIPYRLYALNYYDFRSDYQSGLAGLVPALPKGGDGVSSAVSRPLAVSRNVVLGIIAIALVLLLGGGAIAAGSGLFAPTVEAPLNTDEPATEATISLPLNETPATAAPTPSDPFVISIGNLSKLALRDPLVGHTDYVRSVAWSPDGTRLASAGRDGMVILWNMLTGESTTLNEHSDWVNDIAWSPPVADGDPGGLRILSAGSDSQIVEWDATNGRILRKLTGQEGEIYAVAWSPDGRLVASGAEDQSIYIRNAASGEVIHTLLTDSSVFSLAWSPDGKVLASGGSGKVVQLWDAGSGQSIKTMEGHSGSIYALTWSRVTNTLASGSADSSAIIWNLESAEPLLTLAGHTQQIYGAAWSPDGTMLVTVAADHSQIFWNAADGSPLRRVVPHTEPVTCISWSPDSKHIATGSWDMNVAIWDIAP